MRGNCPGSEPHLGRRDPCWGARGPEAHWVAALAAQQTALGGHLGCPVLASLVPPAPRFAGCLGLARHIPSSPYGCACSGRLNPAESCSEHCILQGNHATDDFNSAA